MAISTELARRYHRKVDRAADSAQRIKNLWDTKDESGTQFAGQAFWYSVCTTKGRCSQKHRYRLETALRVWCEDAFQVKFSFHKHGKKLANLVVPCAVQKFRNTPRSHQMYLWPQTAHSPSNCTAPHRTADCSLFLGCVNYTWCTACKSNHVACLLWLHRKEPTIRRK